MKYLIIPVMVLLTAAGANAQQFTAVFTLSDGEFESELTIGVHPEATNDSHNIDLDLLAPPPPPGAAFDIRLVVEGIDYFTKYQKLEGDSLVYRFEFEEAPDNDPITISWNESIFEYASFEFRDAFTGEFVEGDLQDFDGSFTPADVSGLIENEFELVVTPIDRDAESLSASVSGPWEGWRTLTAPAQGITYGDLLDGIWTQGFEGAGADEGDSNVYWYEESTREWHSPDNASNIIGTSSDVVADNAGNAFLIFVYEDDNASGTPDAWPKVLNIEEAPVVGDVILSFESTNPGDDLEGYHLVGNPYPFAIDWTEMVDDGAIENISTTIHIFDANVDDGEGGYRENHGTNILGFPSSLDSDGVIPAFQAFWVKVLDDSEDGIISFRESYEAVDNPDPFGAGRDQNHIVLGIQGENVQDAFTISLGMDKEYLISRPVPFTTQRTNFGLRQGETVYSRMKTGEMFEGDTMELPLAMSSMKSGEFEISLINADEIIDDYTFMLADLLTGTETELTPGNGYTFYSESSETKSMDSVSLPQLPVKDEIQLLPVEDRFILHLTRNNYSSTGPGDENPSDFELAQNYPNPFNPVTRIQYTIAETGPVSLAVYDVIGQRVATLVNTVQSAGEYDVSFDAGSLNSGVYFYRLTTDSFSKTRKMMLIK